MPRRIPVGPFPHYYAIVDDEDYEELSNLNWQPQIVSGSLAVYAVTHKRNKHTQRK